ncbi:MAG: efflux RND transporter permease subunit, partial [Nautiliaceae bacterium]
MFAIIGFMFVFGIIGLIKMPKNLFPDANRPEVVIFTSSPGASARVVASSISKPIEEEMATLSDVYEITSTNVPNFSIVHVVFDYTKSLQDGAVDVSNALKRVILPKNSVSAIYLVGDFTAPVDVFALSPKNNSTTLDEIRKLAKAFIKPKLLANKEIGNVDIFGGYESAIMIKIDPFLLKKYNISLKELLDVLKSNQDMPVGFLKSEKNFFTLSFYGEKKEIEKLKNIFIAKNVRLKDIADVKWSYQTNNSAYIGNNKDALAIVIQRPINGSVLGASNAARKIMDEVKKEYPNIKISISDTQRNLIETSNDNMLEALKDAIIYTLFVLLIFLANFRALIAAAIS